MTYRSYIGSPATAVTNEAGGYAQSLMMYDIAAIQRMYGADFGFNAGNTTYTFDTTTGEMFVNGVGQGRPFANRIFRTIWDGNGIDTYNFSNYTTNLNIDLTPGGWVNLDRSGNFQRANLGGGTGGGLHPGHARGHVFNALQFGSDRRSLIENAVGGSGNDVITGNAANNTLSGGAGNDTLNGGAGADRLDGGSGIDTLSYVGSNAGVTVNLATRTATGGHATGDVITGFENLTGSSYADILTGSIGANTLSGGAGNDTLNGGAGNDILNGGARIDALTGGTGADTFVFQFGQSILSAMDRITDFAIGTDKIDLLTAGGAAMAAPAAFSRAINNAASTLTSLVSNVFTDANGSLAGNQALGLNSAALVVATASSIAGTYLVINDNVSGFQTANDLVINLTGYTGALPALGTISVSSWFV